ncbi:hypothetical protein RD792_014802 [Penstemon davidsonii]|uniref:Kinesin-like protein n=1 Tax=Penstemon davidsonii TaxID=160366 RepID=A0ABR0CRY1_9LAMI|nr:hypothetical protein RD792_014802 [Penstemon davidsonii]
MDRQVKDSARINNSTFPSDVFQPTSSNNGETNATQRGSLVEWLNSILPPYVNLSINASDEELRAFLIDGSVLCLILNKLKPGSVPESGGLISSSENVQRFLSAMDEMKLPRFQAADLEKGSMKIVLECLLTLQTQFTPNSIPRLKVLGERRVSGGGSPREEPIRLTSSPSKNSRALRSPVMAEPSASLLHQVGHKFHEVFQLKQGSYTDLPAAKISEMMKSNSLDNAPTQSLLSVVNGILDESIERKSGEIPHRVACLLRKVVQEIERRISTQAEHLRTQNNLFKSREEKYQSRIRVLEALATGTSEETQIVMNQLQQIKSEKNKIEEKKKVEEQDVVKLKKEKNDHNEEIESLKKAKDDHNQELEALKKEKDDRNREIEALKKEKDDRNREIEALKKELELARRTHEQKSLEMKAEAREAQQELESKLKEVLSLLTESRKRVKELEAFSESKSERWSKNQHIYQIFTDFQLGALRELKFASQSIRQDIMRTQKSYSEEFSDLGSRIMALDDAAKNYYSLLAENRRMHNELQELKGNIRVYCRIRPFLPGQKGKQTIIEYVGENGELIVLNPTKQGKEGRRSFKFNKVYGPTATQAEVFVDTQQLIQSVLDGYNVCIFAYGQTGSGKTYTMTGPDNATEEEWGVNYRALNDLFRISQTRKTTFRYEISVQMVEIYNEQVRDLLSTDGPPKKYPSLLNSTSDVLKLMDIGLKNRAQSSTALNQRSSRSHSVVSIHARGIDLKSSSTLRGSLHLVDLAGSERVDRSEVTGDRLKEAQHINKSLSALGDVIFALAQKNSHVPYRNSKLTQVLQSSLGGQAKTLMFVQLNPDSDSFSESISTLKFAERVSGVELGAAKSSKDGRDVRELMEQVTSLKDTIAKKDEEIEKLQLVKDKGGGGNGEKRGTNSLRYGGNGFENAASSDHDDYSEGSSDNNNNNNNTKHSIASNYSRMSNDVFRQRKESLQRSKSTAGGYIGQTHSADDADNDERLSDKSDGILSMGTETEGSHESSPVHDQAKLPEKTDKAKSASKVPRPLVKSARESPKASTALRKSTSGTNLSAAKSSRRWQ